MTERREQRREDTPPPPRLPWALAWRIAFGQIVAWGILYYAFTVVVGPIQTATGWSRTFLNAGLSLGLLTWGVCALPVGAWIQRRGGRGVMTLSSALGGAALALMGAVPEPVAYIIAWLVLGSAMAGLLYDSAFAVVTHAFGAEYRRGVTLITLVGGLASTAFIPLAHLAVEQLGWRNALIALGVFQVGIGVPLHWFGIPRFTPAVRSGTVSTKARVRAWWEEFRRDIFDPRFVGLALWFTAHSAAFTGLIFQLVPILQALGADNGTIVKAIAVMGPLQVLGRFFLATRGHHFSAPQVGRWAMAGLVSAVLILLVLPTTLGWLMVFAALFGVSNGVLTIVRGVAIAEFFGRERYAELNGALSAPAVLAKAGAPLALAGVWTLSGEPKAVFAAVLLALISGSWGLYLANKAQRRRLVSATAETKPAPVSAH